HSPTECTNKYAGERIRWGPRHVTDLIQHLSSGFSENRADPVVDQDKLNGGDSQPLPAAEPSSSSPSLSTETEKPNGKILPAISTETSSLQKTRTLLILDSQDNSLLYAFPKSNISTILGLESDSLLRVPHFQREHFHPQDFSTFMQNMQKIMTFSPTQQKQTQQQQPHRQHASSFSSSSSSTSDSSKSPLKSPPDVHSPTYFSAPTSQAQVSTVEP
ncbi:hypothetical protein HK102_009337, partial [Quaeritorhiza haematococci]